MSEVLLDKWWQDVVGVDLCDSSNTQDAAVRLQVAADKLAYALSTAKTEKKIAPGHILVAKIQRAVSETKALVPKAKSAWMTDCVPLRTQVFELLDRVYVLGKQLETLANVNYALPAPTPRVVPGGGYGWAWIVLVGAGSYLLYTRVLTPWWKSYRTEQKSRKRLKKFGYAG